MANATLKRLSLDRGCLWLHTRRPSEVGFISFFSGLMLLSLSLSAPMRISSLALPDCDGVERVRHERAADPPERAA